MIIPHLKPSEGFFSQKVYLQSQKQTTAQSEDGDLARITHDDYLYTTIT